MRRWVIALALCLLPVVAWAQCSPTNPTACGGTTLNTLTLGSQINLGSWTTSGRPLNPATGATGFNTTTSLTETWNGSAWVASGGGVAGPGSTTSGYIPTWGNTSGTSLGAGIPTTGSGNAVLSTSPSLTTPALGTPTSLTLTNATGLPNSGLINNTISGVGLGSNLNPLTFGPHLSAGGSTYNGTTNITITSDATNANTASTIVSRDSSGNFSAGTIAAGLTGHASLDCALGGCTYTGTITGPDSGTWSSTGISATGANVTGTGGYKLGGSAFLNALGSGQSITLGLGAGTSLPSNDIESVIIGWHSLQNWPTTTGENTTLGWNNGQSLLGGPGGNTLVGDDVLAFEVDTSSDSCYGADTCRDIMGTTQDSAYGRRAMAYGSPTFSTAVGAVAMNGNSGSVAITGTATNNDVLNVTLTQNTIALTTSSISGTTLTVGAAASNNLGVGIGITGTNVPASTIILAQLTGTTGGAGAYTINNSATVSSENMTAQGYPVIGGLPTTFSATVTTSQTTTSMAAALAAAINANQPAGSNIQAASFANILVVEYPGTQITGEGITVTTSVTGTGTETLTAAQGLSCVYCLAEGYEAFYAANGGAMSYIVALGANTLQGATTMNHVTAVGNYVGSTTLQSGTFDILVGVDSTTDTYSATTSDATSIGYNNLPGSFDTSMGYAALSSTAEDGNYNSAFGARACAGSSGVSAPQANSCFGGLAGRYASTGVNEAFFGYATGQGISGTPLTGNSNSGFGANALGTIQGSANNNTAIGENALAKLTTGQLNTVVGAGAFSSASATSLGENSSLGEGNGGACTTCTYTLLLGYHAMDTTLTTADDLIVINTGHTDISTTVGNTSNAFYLFGNSTTPSISITGMGTVSTEAVTLGGTLSFPNISTSGTIAGSVCMTSANLLLYESGATGCTISLEELKHDITPLADNGDFMRLQPISYGFNDPAQPQHRYGFGARQVNSVDPTLSTFDGTGKLQAFDPNGILALTVAVVQRERREIWMLGAACLLLALWCSGMTVVLVRRR